jgi:circadian clock protein KaiC
MDSVDGGATTIVLDSLNGFAYAMPEERLLGLHLHELVSYLSQQGVTSLHVMTQHGLLEPQATAFDVSYVADTVILLRPFEYAGQVRKAIAVHKRRVGDHERTIREFELKGGRITIGPPLEEFSGVIAGNLRYLGTSLKQRDDP